jgi:hypothetical protein
MKRVFALVCELEDQCLFYRLFVAALIGRAIVSCGRLAASSHSQRKAAGQLQRLSTQWREFLGMFQALSATAKRDPPRKIEGKKAAPVF